MDKLEIKINKFINKQYKIFKLYFKKIKLFIDLPICRRLLVIIQTAVSLVLLGLSTLSNHDHLFDTWYYYTIHFILSVFGIFIIFKETNSKIIFIYILLSSGLLISSSFAFFWYSGQLNLIENTCETNLNCEKEKSYYYSKMMKILALIIVEVISLHPNLSYLIKTQKIERKKESMINLQNNETTSTTETNSTTEILQDSLKSINNLNYSNSDLKSLDLNK